MDDIRSLFSVMKINNVAFHEDIDYTEPVEYLPGFEVSEKDLKDFLINKSLENI